MTDESDLTIGIKKLRRRKRLPVFLFLILMPIMFILNFVENNYFAAKLVYYLFAISLIFSIFLFFFTKCPRCERYFQGFWGLLNPFRNECVHCGLRIIKKNFFNI